MPDLKLGKAPARPRPKDILLQEVVAAGVILPIAPAGFGHYKVFPPDGWGMLGNDEYGDCVFAGSAHETMMINKMNGRDVAFDPGVVLADYSAVTGFDPADPNTDQGTDMHDALNYRRNTGIQDSSEGSERHKIGAYVSLEPGNWHQMLEALRAFDFVAVGFLFPDYAMDQFKAGKPWAYRAGGHIEGGHYVPAVGRPHSWTIATVTWGQVQNMGRRFYEHYCDECYGVLTPETLSEAGKSPEGLDLTALNAALAAL
jgi:hypothetical protein